MTDKSLAEAIRNRVEQLNGNSYPRRSRVMPWGDNHSVEAAMLEIADTLDEWSKEGKYDPKNSVDEES